LRCFEPGLYCLRQYKPLEKADRSTGTLSYTLLSMQSILSKTPAGAPESATRHRVLWLDLLRLICAIEIVGFHWLRAATKTGAFASQLPENFILSYRQLDIGVLEAFHRLQMDSSTMWWHRSTYNAVGLLFGFGWEAVYVFVLLSGFSLALSLGQKGRPSSWLSWVGRRLKRVLFPFYLISIVVATLMFSAVAFSGSRSSAAFQEIHRKLTSNIGSDLVGLAWSQLVLIDPHAPFWQPFFLAPAWWFVPAILLAYALFPTYMWLLQRLGTSKFLILGAVISIVSYSASLRGWLPEFSWNFVVLNECFNFFLGIVLGRYMTTPQGRTSIEKWVRSPGLLSAALAVFIVGNICNLYRITYPVSSLLFTASLALCGAFVARIFTDRHGSSFPQVDPYYLYLIHQPFAFPLIVVSQRLFGSIAVLVGLPLYFCTVLIVTAVFGAVLAKISV
jgi:hypothetical protein